MSDRGHRAQSEKSPADRVSARFARPDRYLDFWVHADVEVERDGRRVAMHARDGGEREEPWRPVNDDLTGREVERAPRGHPIPAMVLSPR